MPGEDTHSWSTTAASNATADSSINWAEGQPRASVNNSARSMMAAHAKERNLQNGSIVTGGTANAQEFTSGVGYTTIPTGLVVKLKVGPTLTNNDLVTLNMDGIGAVTIKNNRGSNAGAGSLLADTYADLIYNGTNWIVLNDPATGAGSAGVLLSRFSASNSSSVVFTGLDATYDYYQVSMLRIRPTIDDAALVMQWSINGGTSYVPDQYSMNFMYHQTSAGTIPPDMIVFNVSLPAITVTPTIDISSTLYPANSIVQLFNFGIATSGATCQGRAVHENFLSGGLFSLDFFGANHVSPNFNAVKFYMNAGNISSGVFLLYGFR